jgi:hypothetical protein
MNIKLIRYRFWYPGCTFRQMMLSPNNGNPKHFKD